MEVYRAWLNYYGPTLVIVALFASLLVALMPWGYRKKESQWFEAIPRGYRRRGKKMRRNRKDYVENVLLSDFTDRIETRVMQGEITRAEAQVLYTRLKRVFPTIRDIFPSADRLKEKIKSRLGKHIEAKLPDAAPPLRRRSMFDPKPERVVM